MAEDENKNKNREKLILLGGIILFLLLAALLFQFLSTRNVLPSMTPSPTPTPVPVSSDNITINLPGMNERVGSTFLVKGKARVFENIVSVRIKNKLNGKIYDQGTAYANAKDMGQFGDFTYYAHLKDDPSLKTGDELLLEAYQNSAKDGSEIDKVTIQLQFLPTLE